jgi:2-polyprenyl-3-methyl-5-hydroxy-6-metoxy-1,4-benzoquinol methylase
MNLIKNPLKVKTESLTDCPHCHSKQLAIWCQSPERSLGLSKQVFTYSQCQSCQVIFLSERPIESEIYKFYPESYQPYQKSCYQQQKNNLSLINKLKLAINSVKNYLDFLFLNNSVKKIKLIYQSSNVGDKLLDFGCGSDHFLNNARDLGWTTIGIDLSESVVKRIQNSGHRGLIMSPTVWEEIEDQSLKLVRMSHVLEHLYNPEEVLKKIYTKMANNSILHIDIPNAYGFSAKMFKAYWWGLECPRHLIFYSPQLLQKVLRNIGFNKFKVIYQSGSADLTRSLGYMLAEIGILKDVNIEQMKDNLWARMLFFVPMKIFSFCHFSDRFHLIAYKD